MCNFPPPPPFFPFFSNHLTNYSKTWAYDGKNVESVAYFLNNSQICKEQYKIQNINSEYFFYRVCYSNH